MVVDASRSPRSIWRRMFNLLLLAVVIVGLTVFIWVKELHHPLSKPPARHTAATVHLIGGKAT